MFRAVIKQRIAMNQPIVADIGVLSGTIKEDKKQKAISKFNAEKVPTNISLGDVLGLYDQYRNNYYWGVIENIDDKVITCNQYESLYADKQLLVPQTETNQKAFYNNSTPSAITDFYLKSMETGHISIANNMSSAYVPTFTSLIDKDKANTFKGITHQIIDNGTEHCVFPTEKENISLENFIYEQFDSYSRIIRPYHKDNKFKIFLINPTSDVEYDTNKIWKYNKLKLYTSWEQISNLKIENEDVENNTVVIFNSDGTTFRGAYTLLNDGNIQQLTSDVAVSNRVGTNKTVYVFDTDNTLEDIARENLPNNLYNHNITFNIGFDGIYKFDDFNLGQKLELRDGNAVYNSILTAWTYSFDQLTDKIHSATFTLGNVRNTLTAKILQSMR